MNRRISVRDAVGRGRELVADEFGTGLVLALMVGGLGIFETILPRAANFAEAVIAEYLSGLSVGTGAMSGLAGAPFLRSWWPCSRANSNALGRRPLGP